MQEAQKQACRYCIEQGKKWGLIIARPKKTKFPKLQKKDFLFRNP